jgi:hypothetical protein
MPDANIVGITTRSRRRVPPSQRDKAKAIVFFQPKPGVLRKVGVLIIVKIA